MSTAGSSGGEACPALGLSAFVHAIQALKVELVSIEDDMLVRLSDQETGELLRRDLQYMTRASVSATRAHSSCCASPRLARAGELFAECPLPGDGTPLTTVGGAGRAPATSAGPGTYQHGAANHCGTCSWHFLAPIAGGRRGAMHLQCPALRLHLYRTMGWSAVHKRVAHGSVQLSTPMPSPRQRTARKGLPCPHLLVPFTLRRRTVPLLPSGCGPPFVHPPVHPPSLRLLSRCSTAAATSCCGWWTAARGSTPS